MHALDTWSQYLTENDYGYLIQYIENVKNNIPNDEMIILSGEPRTGKSTLKNNIYEYLGGELCGRFPMSGEFIYDENIKRLGIFAEIDEISSNKKSIQLIINCIKYNQSFIADTNNIESVNTKLLQHCRIISMTHVF